MVDGTFMGEDWRGGGRALIQRYDRNVCDTLETVMVFSN